MEKPNKVKPTVKPQQQKRDVPSVSTGPTPSSLQCDDPTIFNSSKEVDERPLRPYGRTASESSDTPPETARSVSGRSNTNASSPLGESHAIDTSAQIDAPKHRQIVGGKPLLDKPPPPPDRITQLSDTSSTPSVNELANCPYGGVLQYEAGGHVLVNHAHWSHSNNSPSHVIYGTPTDQDHGGNSPSIVVA